MYLNTTLPKFTFGWKGAAALIGGAFLPLLLLSLVDVAVLLIFKTNIQYKDWYLLVSNTLMWCGAIWAFDFWVCRPETGKKLNFNFSKKNLYTYFLVFPMMFGMGLITEFISFLIPTTGPIFGDLYEFYSTFLNQLSNDTILMVIMAVIMAPIFEEIVFRGIIMKGLLNKGTDPKYAIWISALIFGLIHGNPWQFVGATLLGFVLGLVYYKTKSLLLPILLHAFNNLVSTLMMTTFKTESFSDAFHLPEWAILGLGIVIFATFYYLFTKRYKVAYSEENTNF